VGIFELVVEKEEEDDEMEADFKFRHFFLRNISFFLA